MTKLQRSSFVLCLTLIASHAFAANTEYKGGNQTLYGEEFHYTIAFQKQDRFVAVEHLSKKYEGPLAEISFRERHMQILKMTFLLTKDSCPNGVGALGNIRLRKDPEQDEDPDAVHPQYLILTYSCK